MKLKKYFSESLSVDGLLEYINVSGKVSCIYDLADILADDIKKAMKLDRETLNSIPKPVLNVFRTLLLAIDSANEANQMLKDLGLPESQKFMEYFDKNEYILEVEIPLEDDVEETEDNSEEIPSNNSGKVLEFNKYKK